jgi:2-polyprenyl-3-methyl-5-hydroxy-6-metoxy-1,4-benzoquinol methylase
VPKTVVVVAETVVRAEARATVTATAKPHPSACFLLAGGFIIYIHNMNYCFYNKIKDEKLVSASKQLSVLDIGPRNGLFSLPFLKEGHKVAVVDKNKKWIDVIKKRIRKPEEKEKLELHNLSITDFHSKKKYDVILARNIFQFLGSKKEFDETLIKVKGMLKKNGVLHFTMFGKNHEWVTRKEDPLICSTKQHIFNLIDDLEYYSHYEEEGRTMAGNGKVTYWHGYGFWVRNTKGGKTK